MELVSLPPPRPLVESPERRDARRAESRRPSNESAANSRGSAPSQDAPLPPELRALASPHRTRLGTRRFSDPASGWWRRLERATSNWLGRHVLPRIPGVERPYSRLLERQLTVSEAEVGVVGLGSDLDGLRVLLLTDVHAGPYVSRSVLERVFTRLASLEPDLILLGGDFVTTRVEELRSHSQAFPRLVAPMGTFAVLGNHDHYTRDPVGVRRELSALGIQVLHNRGITLGGTKGLFLAGIDDLVEGEPCLDRAFGSRPAGCPAILLSHNPDVLGPAASRGTALVLSGHTHGGQVRLPGLPVLVRQSRFGLHEGRYALDGCQLIVSRGLGVTGIPLRLNCPPEAILVTLRTKD